MKLFDHLNNLTLKKNELSDEDSKEYNQFMIDKFISCCELYIPFVNEINRYRVPKSIHHEYYRTLLPKRKEFFKYIFKKESDTELVKNISDYLSVSMKEAETYSKVLTKEQIKTINGAFENGKTKN